MTPLEMLTDVSHQLCAATLCVCVRGYVPEKRQTALSAVARRCPHTKYSMAISHCPNVISAATCSAPPPPPPLLHKKQSIIIIRALDISLIIATITHAQLRGRESQYYATGKGLRDKSVRIISSVSLISQSYPDLIE